MLKYNLTWALLLWWGALDGGHHPDYVKMCAREVIDEHRFAAATLGLEIVDDYLA